MSEKHAEGFVREEDMNEVLQLVGRVDGRVSKVERAVENLTTSMGDVASSVREMSKSVQEFVRVETQQAADRKLLDELREDQKTETIRLYQRLDEFSTRLVRVEEKVQTATNNQSKMSAGAWDLIKGALLLIVGAVVGALKFGSGGAQ